VFLASNQLRYWQPNLQQLRAKIHKTQ